MSDKIDTSRMIFVFGSNEGGIHGAGAAKYACDKRGAKYGDSYGMTGSCFAIPTKAVSFDPKADRAFVSHTLPLDQINDYVRGFLAFARGHPETQFQVTCIGCGLAGLKHEDIAPMFRDAPSNCWFDLKWEPYFNVLTQQFWGEG